MPNETKNRFEADAQEAKAQRIAKAIIEKAKADKVKPSDAVPLSAAEWLSLYWLLRERTPINPETIQRVREIVAEAQRADLHEARALFGTHIGEA